MVEEDEIDLRPYVMTVLRHWKVVAGMTALFAAIAAAISFTTPVTYEAASTVAIAAPGAQPAPAAKAYLDLATSDTVVAALAKGLPVVTGSPALSAAVLKSELKAVQGSDPSQVTLQVRDTNPGRASQIASAWATAFVAASNSTFNNTQAILKGLESQSKSAQGQLTQAEADLAAQESRDSVAVLQAQLTAQQNNLASLYGTRASLQAAAAHAERLRSQLRQLDPNIPSSLGDDLAILQLQLRVLNVPAQLQLPGALASSGRTVGAQMSYLDGLAALISDRTAETDKRIAAAQSAILDLQGKLQQATDQEIPLVARRDNARQLIRDLDLKTTQARIAAEAGTNQAHVIGDLAVPAMALSRGTTRNAVVAAVFGSITGLAVALGIARVASRKMAILERQPAP